MSCAGADLSESTPLTSGGLGEITSKAGNLGFKPSLHAFHSHWDSLGAACLSLGTTPRLQWPWEG